MSIQNKKERNDTKQNSQQRQDLREKENKHEKRSLEERGGLKNIQNKIKKGIEKQKGNQNQEKFEKNKQNNVKQKIDENNKLGNKMKNFQKGKYDEKVNEDHEGRGTEERNKVDWEEDFKKGQSQVKNSLRKGNKDLNVELEKAYQGILQNCLKQSEDEPHKMQKCWDEFSLKMKPIFKILQQKSMQSGETLKKCFQSKSNAKECVREGIDFGQKALNDASSSLKQYLA